MKIIMVHQLPCVCVCFPFGYTAQFMPIQQRICNQCAHANINVDLSDHAEENVLVAISIHLKYCV